MPNEDLDSMKEEDLDPSEDSEAPEGSALSVFTTAAAATAHASLGSPSARALEAARWMASVPSGFAIDASAPRASNASTASTRA